MNNTYLRLYRQLTEVFLSHYVHAFVDLASFRYVIMPLRNFVWIIITYIMHSYITYQFIVNVAACNDSLYYKQNVV